MKIAILGTRGIPNNHGGFEQFAEYLSKHLADNGHEIYVYNSHTHPFQGKIWKGVNIIHCKDPEDRIGTAGQFIYDLNCILDSRKKNFDVILQLGYTSSSVWGWLLPKTPVIITNMDGLEWKRSKYSKPVRSFLKLAEKLAVNTSDHLISDSVGIRDYLKTKYTKDSEYIAYGADIFDNPDVKVLSEYDLDEYGYNILIARLEPENNIETILSAVSSCNDSKPFLVIGKHHTKYGGYLKRKFQNHSQIRFLGGIYNKEHLDNLRYFSNIYFHGHSVGGTNPSLLEAMASNTFIIAHDNIFNISVLGEDAFYFKSSEDIIDVLGKKKHDHFSFIEGNHEKIRNLYSWENINAAYECFLLKCLKGN